MTASEDTKECAEPLSTKESCLILSIYRVMRFTYRLGATSSRASISPRGVIMAKIDFLLISGIQIDRISTGGEVVSRSFGVESRAPLLVERCVMYEWAELRHFRYLLTILERQGLRAAAEELHTAQPNLSVQARQFQENASVRLFRKMKGGRIRPTETGLAFIALAKLLLETRDEIMNALSAIERGEVSSVRFGCTPLADHGLFRTFCALHKEILPVCPVRPTHGDAAHLAEEVVSGTVDAAFVTLPLLHPDQRIEELRRDRLVV